MKFAIIVKNKFVEITTTVAKILEIEVDDCYAMEIRGGGMDMVFMTLARFYDKLGYGGIYMEATQYKSF